MKNKKFLVLLIILLICGIVFATNNSAKTEEVAEEETTETTESEVIKTDILNTVSSSSYVETALEEKKELRAAYYFEEIYVAENQKVASGENLLKYTNGKYMTAPYDCIITEISVPDAEEMCTYDHYIKIQATDSLKISVSVDEDQIDKVYLGQEAQIDLEASGKSITGYVTSIGNTANYSSNGSKFSVDVEFQNDGEIMLGMSAKCAIILEKAESVIGVATEAITEQNGEKYVTLKSGDSKTTQVKVETGISNDAYTEVKSGLSEGDIVIIEKEESSSGGMMNFMRQENSRGGEMSGGFEKMDGGGTPPQMPNMK